MKQTKDNMYHTKDFTANEFPLEIYVVTKSGITPDDGRGYQDLHWHEELQFTFVITGMLEVLVNGVRYQVNSGEAIFINRNLLHMTTGLTENGKYISIDFPDKILGFYSGSPMLQKYVLPYTSNPVFPVIIFRENVKWQNEILQELHLIQTLYNNKNEKWKEYQIAMKLTRIWFLIISNVSEDVHEAPKGYIRKIMRVQNMIMYIHKNYMYDLRLIDIAESAGISERECRRCFQEIIHENPIQYLLNYRIDKSKELLNGTDYSVSEIAIRCGFNDASHFIQSFKQKTWKTPGEYRI